MCIRDSTKTAIGRHFTNDFKEGGIFDRAYQQFAEKVVHAITHKRDRSRRRDRGRPAFSRRNQPTLALEKKPYRELRQARRLLSYLSDQPGSPHHPRLTKLDTQTLIDCIREEFRECHPLSTSQCIDGVNAIRSMAVLNNPSRLFNLLLDRHRERCKRSAQAKLITPQSALHVPRPFIDKTYRFMGHHYQILELATPIELTMAGAVASHCVGDEEWSALIRAGALKLLSVSKILSRPQKLGVLSPYSMRARELIKSAGCDLKVRHQTVVTIEVKLETNACYIGQCKLAYNGKLTRLHGLSHLLFSTRLMRDLTQELTRRYGHVSWYGHDFDLLHGGSPFFTIDGKGKRLKDLQANDIVITGEIITLDPETLTAERLAVLASLSNATLKCTQLFDDDSDAARALCATLTVIKCRLAYSGKTLTMTNDRFPNLISMTSMFAPNVEAITIDLPNMTTVGMIFAPTRATRSINLPPAKQIIDPEASLQIAFGLHISPSNLNFETPLLQEDVP